MEFKDYYAALGIERSASADEVKRAYRKQARKYHPDVSKEPNAEVRFKEVAEANEVLKDPEKRAAYDAVGSRWGAKPGAAGEGGFNPPPDWASGFEFSGDGAGRGSHTSAEEAAAHSAFFEALFGRRAGGGPGAHAGGHGGHGGSGRPQRGQDHHARVRIDLIDAYRGGKRSIQLRAPKLMPDGHVQLQEREVQLQIPKGIRAGQQLRLAGQGGPAMNGGPAGDLFLEIEFNPHPLYRVDGRDVHFDLPLAPWEAALGAAVEVPTPEGAVNLNILAGTAAGRQLRLRGRGLPGSPPGNPAGDLFAHVQIVLPSDNSGPVQEAWRALAQAAAFNPRAKLEG